MYCNFLNAHYLFFCNVEHLYDGLDTLSVPNHVFSLSVFDGGILYNGISVVGCVQKLTRFPDCEKIDQNLYNNFQESVLTDDHNKSAFGLEYTNPTHTCINVNYFLHEKTLILSPNHTNPSFSNCGSLDTPQNKKFLLKILNRYITNFKPTHVVEVLTWKLPEENPLTYGKPMYCHNFVVNLACIEIGNIFTCKHLLRRLLSSTWNNQTNFQAALLYQNPEYDIKLDD